MANLKNVIYLSNEDYETLVSAGTVTIDGETLTYDENNVYVTPDKIASSTEDGLMSASDKSKLDSIESGAEVNVQSDWDVTDSTSEAYIKNKPTISTVNNGTLTIQKNGTAVATFTANQSSNVTANITVPTVPTTTTANKLLVSTATSDSPKWSDWSSVGFLKTNASGVINVDTNTYIDTGSTEQTKTGKLTLSGGAVISKYTLGDVPLRTHTSGDATIDPQYIKLSNGQGRNQSIQGLKVVSGDGDHLYCCDYRPGFTITSTYKGNGDSDVYSSDGYSIINGVAGTGANSIRYLFDGSLSTGMMVPTTNLSTNPWIITILNTSAIEYTDVLSLTFYQHRLSTYGYLTDYKLEVTTDGETWVTVINRTGVQDNINGMTLPLSNLSTYIQIKGIRFTITGCKPTSSYATNQINISQIELRNSRPSYTVPESLGAISSRGGILYGSLIMGGLSEASIRPLTNKTRSIGTASYMFSSIYGETFYENGTSLSSKYLGKTAKAADADKLDGNDSTYYLNYNNLTNKPTIPVVPTNISAFTNDSGYITSSALSGYATETWVGQQGYQTASDVSTTVSTAINGLATVARSGSYNDLSDRPTSTTTLYKHTFSFRIQVNPQMGDFGVTFNVDIITSLTAEQLPITESFSWMDGLFSTYFDDQGGIPAYGWYGEIVGQYEGIIFTCLEALGQEQYRFWYRDYDNGRLIKEYYDISNQTSGMTVYIGRRVFPLNR